MEEVELDPEPFRTILKIRGHEYVVVRISWSGEEMTIGLESKAAIERRYGPICES